MKSVVAKSRSEFRLAGTWVLALALSAGCSKAEPPSSTAEPPSSTAEPPSSTVELPKSAPATSTVTTAPVPDLRPASGSALVPIPNAALFEGILVGGHPSDEDLRAAKEAGYKTIVNLQLESEPGVAEERAAVEALGMKYVGIPIAGASGMTEKHAAALDDALASNPGPAMVHCASGNRVGALFALRSYFVQGKPPAAALQDGERAGLRGLEPVVRRVLGL